MAVEEVKFKEPPAQATDPTSVLGSAYHGASSELRAGLVGPSGIVFGKAKVCQARAAESGLCPGSRVILFQEV